MEILFEDKEIVVCIKPVGVLSQADMGGKENMIDLLSAHCGCKVYPLHRLDREVGGVMVYAKTQQAAAFLSREIAEHRFVKEYVALVKGAPAPNMGKMRDLLFKDSRKNKSYVVNRPRKGVKEALLDYKIVGQAEINGQIYSLAWVRLHTGRTHQIRVQFASRQHPLAGDQKYGGKDEFKGIGLWSYQITLTHPKTRRTLNFSQMPDVQWQSRFCKIQNFILDDIYPTLPDKKALEIIR